MTNSATSAPSVRQLVVLAVPAVLIGVGSAVVLKLLDWLSELLGGLLWDVLPGAVGASSTTPWWIFLVLTLTGAAVGAIVWLVPGHAGVDSATAEMDAPPPPLLAVPGLFAAVIVSLAGGVSLGPENPIIAVNAALATAALARLSAVPRQLVVMLAIAGTVGALFGTPVAAALLFTGIVGSMRTGGSLWDKLFLPVAAGGAGAVTSLLLGGQQLAFHLDPIGPVQPVYLVTGFVAAAGSALVGILMAVLFPHLHRLFHAMGNPLLFTTIGGAVLGVLAIIGGPLTMFKGLEQTGELLTNPAGYSAAQLAVLAGVKVVALLVSASAGFRGGRIFPAVFIGTALGLLVHALIPGLPLGLAVACAVMGMTLVAARDGWMAIFVAVALAGDVAVLPLLCLIILPVWLIVTKSPELVIEEPAGTDRANAQA